MEKPDELVLWLREHNVIEITAGYEHDGMGVNSWVTFRLVTDDGHARTAKGDDLRRCTDFNMNAWPCSLVTLKPHINTAAFEWEEFERKHKDDLARYKSLGKKLGITGDVA